MRGLVCAVLLVAVMASAVRAMPLNDTVGFCGYQATCSVGGITGVCVSISQGCCHGQVAGGLCPGSADIKCCVNNPCSTPQGNGVCKQSSACSGRAIAGYCSGPANVQCCVAGGGGCTLGSAVAGGNCDSDGLTKGLTNQIIQELSAMGYGFRDLDPRWVHCPNFHCALQSSAAQALEDAARSKGDFITLNSAFRSAAEQYVLYRWYQSGHKCDIPLAAPPGGSNHEGGRAIDTSNYNYWLSALAAHGWAHTYPESDRVHFDYNAAPNLSSRNLQAFQRLHNRHSGNKIAEDGIYGPATEAALRDAPCNGW